MYTHAQRHMYTHRHVQTLIHTDTYTHVHTHRHVQIHKCTYTQTHVQLYMRARARAHCHPPPPIKSCSTSLFTHRSGYCTLGGGREHITHSLLCFHCTQLLSSLTAPSANDRSGLSSKPAQQGGPGGHTCPHHNFHSPLASRRVEISSP
ncbi:unnamed protein product, partial [Staurois parvus]